MLDRAHASRGGVRVSAAVFGLGEDGTGRPALGAAAEDIVEDGIDARLLHVRVGGEVEVGVEKRQIPHERVQALRDIRALSPQAAKPAGKGARLDCGGASRAPVAEIGDGELGLVEGAVKLGDRRLVAGRLLFERGHPAQKAVDLVARAGELQIRLFRSGGKERASLQRVLFRAGQTGGQLLDALDARLRGQLSMERRNVQRIPAPDRFQEPGLGP